MKETKGASDPKLFLRFAWFCREPDRTCGGPLSRWLYEGRWRSCVKCYSQFVAQREAVKKLADDGGKREIGEVLGVDAIRR